MILAGCGGLGAESPARFTAARVISQDTENGATPMFVAMPDGGSVVAWVSAPGGGSDGSLHVSVTPPGAAEPLAAVTVRDRLGPIEAHGEAPPQLAADSAGGISVLYTVGKEVPGERFPKSALRFIRSADSGRTWSEPRTINDGAEFGSHNFHALTAAPDGSLLATWLDAQAGEVRRLDEPLDRRRTHLGAEPADLQRSHLSLLPHRGGGRGGRDDLRRLARDSAG